MNILEQIGITKDDLIEKVVERILGFTADYKRTGEESWEEVPLSSVVDKKITEAIGNLVETMKVKIHERIDVIMDAEIQKVFTTPFQPVTRWNEPIGELTTIKDMIADEAQEYWTTKVDSDGKTDGYSDKSERAIYFARRVMTEYYEKELVATVKQMATELKQKIPLTIADEISKTVVKHLK